MQYEKEIAHWNIIMICVNSEVAIPDNAEVKVKIDLCKMAYIA